jgi:hypothetical protein
MSAINDVLIYTDGSCLNGGHGGWACLLMTTMMANVEPPYE